MPQAANISINDGESTPVAHVFVPSKVSDLIATYYGPGLTLAGREYIVVTRREATATVAGKVNIKVVLPTEVTVSGVTTVELQELVSMDFVLSPKGTKQKRKNTRVLSSNLLLNATIAAVIDDGDGIF